jgi:hypothetical protein
MSTITKQQLSETFAIDLDQGKFFWKNVSKYHNTLNGLEAGNAQKTHSKVYWVISLNGKKHKRSRLMFLYVNDRFPTPCVDHINGNSLDDRIQNLREASLLENAWNHKMRKRQIDLPMGVRSMANGKFQARIGYQGKQLHLGVFETPDEAKTIYETKRKELYGKFA